MLVGDVTDLTRIKRIGFADADVDPTLDLVSEIGKMRRDKNAVILAHYYQEGEIQDIADFVGDSLALSQKAASTDADMIFFAGVHFMAETAKILNPDKKVIIPDLNAGCSLSDSCPPEEFRKFREAHPDHLVITYINCSAGIKALSDIIVTSSNCVEIVKTIPADQPVIFAPDKNLGVYVERMTGRKMLLWNGACMVHEIFSARKIAELKIRHPEAKLIAHPECETAVLELADFIGSTSQLIKFVKTDSGESFIVGTESGIIHEMQKEAPEKKLIPGPGNSTCACNDCPHMKLNTLEKLYLCMKYELPEVEVEETLRLKAWKPIVKMLELSRSLGL